MLPFALFFEPAYGSVHVGVRHQGCNLRNEFVIFPWAHGRFKAENAVTRTGHQRHLIFLSSIHFLLLIAVFILKYLLRHRLLMHFRVPKRIVNRAADP